MGKQMGLNGKKKNIRNETKSRKIKKIHLKDIHTIDQFEGLKAKETIFDFYDRRNGKEDSSIVFDIEDNKLYLLRKNPIKNQESVAYIINSFYFNQRKKKFYKTIYVEERIGINDLRIKEFSELIKKLHD